MLDIEKYQKGFTERMSLQGQTRNVQKHSQQDARTQQRNSLFGTVNATSGNQKLATSSIDAQLEKMLENGMSSLGKDPTHFKTNKPVITEHESLLQAKRSDPKAKNRTKSYQRVPPVQSVSLTRDDDQDLIVTSSACFGGVSVSPDKVNAAKKQLKQSQTHQRINTSNS